MSVLKPHGEDYQAGVETVHDAGFNLAWDQPAATVPPELTEHSKKMAARIYRVAGCVYCAVGYAVANVIFIVGKDGLVVCDTTESLPAAKRVFEDFKRAVPQAAALPIRAVVYTHNHLDHIAGVRAFATDEEVASGKIKIIAHESLLSILINNASLVGPILALRALYSFGNLIEHGPKGHVNCGLGPALLREGASFIAPSVTFAERLDITLAGIRMEFRYAPSEADDEIVIWLPDLQVLLSAEVVQGECFANVHTIRGTLYRDPVKWYKSIDMMRAFAAEFMVPAHGRPVAGRDKVQNLLTAYRDAIQFVHDQTVRHMNLGATPDEIAEAVPHLPEHLAQHAWLGEYYGTVKHSARQVYNGQLGWFEGDPTFLDPLPRSERARRTVQMMGGRDAVVKEARACLEQAEWRWCAEILTHVLRADAGDMEARGLKAQALRELGYRTVNSNWRNWYLTSALELESALGALDPRALTGAFGSTDFITQLPLSAFFEFFTVRIDPHKCMDTNLTLAFRFTDRGETYALEVRRGVVEVHHKQPQKTDAVLALAAKTLYANGRQFVPKLPQLLQSGEVRIEQGTPTVLLAFFACFDKPIAELPRLTLR